VQLADLLIVRCLPAWLTPKQVADVEGVVEEVM